MMKTIRNRDKKKKRQIFNYLKVKVVFIIIPGTSGKLEIDDQTRIKQNWWKNPDEVRTIRMVRIQTETSSNNGNGQNTVLGSDHTEIRIREIIKITNWSIGRCRPDTWRKNWKTGDDMKTDSVVLYRYCFSGNRSCSSYSKKGRCKAWRKQVKTLTLDAAVLSAGKFRVRSIHAFARICRYDHTVSSIVSSDSADVRQQMKRRRQAAEKNCC